MDLTVASSWYDIPMCSETLVQDMRHLSELLVPRFGRPVLLCLGRMPRARGMEAYVEMDMEHFANPNLSWLLRNAGFGGLRCRTELICL